MATIVCQGLQSCLECQLVESRTLRLKLSSTKIHFPQPLEFGPKFQSSAPDHGGWSFIQALSDASKSSTQKEKPHVSPQIKRTLNEKSLELCTENLGSETGTYIPEDIIFSMSSDSKSGYSPTREQQKPHQILSSRKGNCGSFPPPLTTMRGSESLQVIPLREDGRLIIQAVKALSRHTYFQHERIHGHLRLTLFKDSFSSSTFDYFNDADNEHEFANDDSNELVAKESVVEKEMDRYRISFGDEMGSEKINQRPSRWKEGEQDKNGLSDWEPH